jgi:hypothetical protein
MCPAYMAISHNWPKKKEKKKKEKPLLEGGA